MTNILAPITLSEPVRAGRRRFWKQILPVTEIDYEGKKIKFDPTFHMDLAEAFNKGAYDQVPLVFAGERNEHNMDPRNFGGDIVKVEYRGPAKGQGTWALIEADRAAAREIRRNPKLGVSARIKQGLEKADGRFFKRAVNHVLLTMNPKVTGMSPWQAVDLSEDTDTEVVDLTAVEYQEGSIMPKTKTRRGSRRQSSHNIDLAALSDEEFSDLVVDLAAMAPERDLEDQDVDDLEDDEDEEDVEDVQPPRRRKSKVKTTKVVERESEDDDEDPDLDPDAELSDEDEDDEDEDHPVRRSERSQFQQMRWDLAEREWQRTRDNYLRDGVPAYLLDLAEPVLTQPDDVTIDLSDDDETVDVKATIVKMLDGVERIVDLTGELGHQVDLADDEDDEAQALLDQWNETYPA